VIRKNPPAIHGLVTHTQQFRCRLDQGSFVTTVFSLPGALRGALSSHRLQFAGAGRGAKTSFDTRPRERTILNPVAAVQAQVSLKTLKGERTVHVFARPTMLLQKLPAGTVKIF